MQLGSRMKAYEETTRQVLPRRSYSIIRVDIRSAHTYMKGAKKPFDISFMEDMDYVAIALCRDIQGAQFAYTQSDEVSVLVTDFDTLETQPWFGGVVAKQASVAASIATAELVNATGDTVHFDGRVFTLPDAVEVANYFVWRQKDWIRNAVHMKARTYLSHKACQGLSTDQLQEEMMILEHDWEKEKLYVRMGRITCKRDEGWVPEPAPEFQARSWTWLARHIPTKDSLETV